MPDTPSLLILPNRRAPGTVQMAIDAALLGWAAAGFGRAVFRTYSWSRPTLSLGRAEPFPEGWDEEAISESGVEVVRRPTGGDAVFHATELTFAVAVSLPGPWRLRPRGFADRVADALAGAFREAGLGAERVAPAPIVAGDGDTRPGSQACFSRTAPGEVRVGSFKVAGIASRFTRGAALSHASVPLTEEFRDVARFRRFDRSAQHAALHACARSATELAASALHEERIAAALARELSHALGASPRHASFAEVSLDDPHDAIPRAEGARGNPGVAVCPEPDVVRP